MVKCERVSAGTVEAHGVFCLQYFLVPGAFTYAESWTDEIAIASLHLSRYANKIKIDKKRNHSSYSNSISLAMRGTQRKNHFLPPLSWFKFPKSSYHR